MATPRPYVTMIAQLDTSHHIIHRKHRYVSLAFGLRRAAGVLCNDDRSRARHAARARGRREAVLQTLGQQTYSRVYLIRIPLSH